MAEKINYEPETLRIFDNVLKDGDTVIIAGAHQGYFASYCSNLVGSGKVYAFEPNTINYNILRESVKNLPNVQTFNFALGDHEAKAVLYVNSDNDGGHALWDVSLNDANVNTKSKQILENVEVKTIDGLFPEGIDNLKLLLLDAEGSEHSILKGAINTINDADTPYIICEINDFALEHCKSSQMDLRGYLSAYGYKSYIMGSEKVCESTKSLTAIMKDTKQALVFNMLFSRRGEV